MPGSFEYMPKPVCLYQFCAMMVQKMRNKVPEGVELQIDEDSPLDAWFSADSGYLNQVVTNFMSNAIKFYASRHHHCRLSDRRPAAT